MKTQENLYNIWMEFVIKHEFRNLVMTLLMNVKGISANILQAWIADIGSNELNQPLFKKFQCGNVFIL